MGLLNSSKCRNSTQSLSYEICHDLRCILFIPVSYLKSGISFKNCVLSTPHILAQIFLTVCKIRTWFFVGTFSNFISVLCGGNRSTGMLCKIVYRKIVIENRRELSKISETAMSELYSLINNHFVFWNNLTYAGKSIARFVKSFEVNFIYS